ncbi:Peroxisome biogenesis protein 5 [Diplonema papillatum]|nr:Peroxisome biogenesis protein 5 [Diplonema papillatum]
MAGFLNDFVGAAGCDGGGNAMSMGIEKMFREGHMRGPVSGPSHHMGMQEEEGVDQLAMMDGPREDWGAEFHQNMVLQHQQREHAMMTGGDWASELIAQRPEGAPANESWADQFNQQPQTDSWVEEFTEGQEEVQTFGVLGEEPATFEAKQNVCASKNFSELTRTAPGPEGWSEEFHQQEDWASQYLNGNWNEQFKDDSWAEQYREMGLEMGADLGSTDNAKDYPFAEENPYMFSENPFQEGLELKEAGCIPQAALAFEAAVRKDETHFEGWKQLGLTQADNDQDTHAVAALLHARALSTNDTSVLLQLGVSFANEGHRSAALDVYKDWLGSHPVFGEDAKKMMAIVEAAEGLAEIDGQEDIGFDYFKQQDKQTKNIIRVFESMSTKVSDPDVHAVLGVLYFLSRDHDKAIEHYQALLRFPGKDTDSRLWNRLGAVTANGGRHQEALAAYNRALDLNPGFVRVHYNIGIAHSMLENYQVAAQAFLKALEIQTSAKSSKGFDGNGAAIWDSLRRAFSCMNRSDLYDLTWKGDLSLFSEFMQPDPFLDDGSKW